MYELVEFAMPTSDDDVVSRLFEFVSIHSHDWLYFPFIMSALIENPLLLVCASQSVDPWQPRIVVNESWPVVSDILRRLSDHDGVPILVLNSSHISWD